MSTHPHPTSSSRHRLAALALAGALTGSLAACGETAGPSEGRPGGAADPAPTTPAATTPDGAVEAWVEAFADHDATAVCALQTTAYSTSTTADLVDLGLADDRATCEEGIVSSYPFTDAVGHDLDDARVEVRQRSGDVARVRIAYADDSSEVYELTREGGSWLVSAELPVGQGAR